MIRTHFAAVKALLSAVTNVTVYTGDDLPEDVELRAIPYVVLYGDTGLGDSPRLSAAMSGRTWTVSTLYVGSTPDEARWVAEKVQAAFRRVRPAVTGEFCTPLRQTANATVRPDQNVRPIMYVATDVWRFSSTATAA